MNDIKVIPQPSKISPSVGEFELKSTTQILFSGDVEKTGQYLQALLQPATGFSLEMEEAANNDPGADVILLTIDRVDTSLGDEGYKLKITPENVIITAAKGAGLFYGVQTLRQLLPSEIECSEPVKNVKWTVPAVEIEDSPRFKWRGMHLDVGRHMFPVEFIKKFIDLMAMHKMDFFHWHLVEDQGWRIEIKKYPKLTEIGSTRRATPIPGDRKKLDGIPYTGFYTQDQVREVVAYAAERFITVVPEIEMPGHTIAALAAYPELGCKGEGYEVRQFWGIEDDVYCAGNERVYEFLEDVLSEVMDLFPSEFIHIGGDECPKVRWKECPKCQAKIKAEGLRDEDELQSYFIRRMEKFLISKGRRLIGWDEILEGGLSKSATVMAWRRGKDYGEIAAKLGNDVVMSPTRHCYFDYYQSENLENEPPAIGNLLTLEKVYAFEPVAESLTVEEARRILGGQGNIWTEYIPTIEQVEYMAFPRTCALAEVVWSPDGDRDYNSFVERLEVLLKRLDVTGVNYRKLG